VLFSQVLPRSYTDAYPREVFFLLVQLLFSIPRAWGFAADACGEGASQSVSRLFTKAFFFFFGDPFLFFLHGPPGLLAL